MSVNGNVMNTKLVKIQQGTRTLLRFWTKAFHLVGYVEVFIQYQMEYYAVIQRLEIHDWPMCEPQSDLSIMCLNMHGDLQGLLAEHIIPASKTGHLNSCTSSLHKNR